MITPDKITLPEAIVMGLHVFYRDGEWWRERTSHEWRFIAAYLYGEEAPFVHMPLTPTGSGVYCVRFRDTGVEQADYEGVTP